jgi:hypothetical protein
MTDDLGTGIFSPATNGATGDSVSALSIGSNGGAKAIDASDVTVTFLIAEINRLAEQISVGAYGSAKGIDASDVKARSTVAFLIAETNRLAEENQRLKDKLGLLDVETDTDGHTLSDEDGGVMSKIERLLEPGSTELPVCRCAAKMNLMAIVPVPGGDTEIRIFRCPDCSHELRLTAWRPC